MEVLKQKRTTAKSQFTRSENRLIEALGNLETFPVATLERRYEDLSLRWNTVQDAHDAYLEAINDPAEAAREEAWIDAIKERYGKIEVQTDQAVQDIKQRTAAESVKAKVEENQIAQQRDTVNPASSLQIERIKLDKFNGDIRKYPKFREQFDLYVKPLCKASQLPFVLRAHLTDEVKEDVDNEDDNMDTLWSRLDKKYGNQSKQVDAILADLAKAPKGDSRSTLQMIKVVEKAYRDLSRMNRGGEMENGTILSLIEKRLPDEIRFEWIEKIAEMSDEGPKEKIEIMLALLQKWKIMIEYDQSAIRKLPEKKLISHHTSTPPRTRRPEKVKEGCWIHTTEKHPIWVCQAFKSMPVEERLELVKGKKACIACLEIKCPGSEDANSCKRKFKCSLDGCNAAHNRLLHQ